jgi:hypothetical protein
MSKKFGKRIYIVVHAKNVHIYHNILYSTGTNPGIDWVVGIVTSGFYDMLMAKNVFDSVYPAAIAITYPTDSSTDFFPKGTGYTTNIGRYGNTTYASL